MWRWYELEGSNDKKAKFSSRSSPSTQLVLHHLSGCLGSQTGATKTSTAGHTLHFVFVPTHAASDARRQSGTTMIEDDFSIFFKARSEVATQQHSCW
jgi:hypothetical protein